MTRLSATALGILVTIAPLFGEGPAEQLAQVTTTQRFSFAPGGTIRVNNSHGDLYIEGWDLAQVEITVIKSTHYFEPSLKEQAGKKLETVQVMSERRSDQALAISTVLPSRADWAPPLPKTGKNGVNLEYVVHVPRDSRLVIDHHGGSVEVGNVTGDVEAANRDGDILLMLPARGSYAIDAQSKMGHIASDFEGRTISRYVFGQRFAAGGSSSARRIHLRTGFGGITIQALPAEGEGLYSAGGEQ